VLQQAAQKEKKSTQASFAVFTDDPAVKVDHCWFRGGWWDPLTMAWNAVKNGEAKAVAPVDANAPGASLYVPFSLDPGKEKTVRLMIAWYTPDSDQTYGDVGKPKENCNPAN